MRRRSFLVGALAAALALGAAAIARLWGGRGASPPPDSVIAPGSGALLLAVTDAIVPRVGEHPAASEIDILPRLERWVGSSPSRRRIYQRGWPRFEREIRARTATRGGSPDPEILTGLLERWYRDYRDGRAREVARFFEQLRRDTLRAYYGSPAGWISLGYNGRPQRGPFPAEPSR